LKDFEWERLVIEPEHVQWINRNRLYFVNDSLIFVTSHSSWFSGDSFYPIKFLLGVENYNGPHSALFIIDDNSICRFPREENTTNVEFGLIDGKIYIGHALW
jgi:hypothetical protein